MQSPDSNSNSDTDSQLSQLLNFLAAASGNGGSNINSMLVAKSNKLVDDMTTLANGTAVTGAVTDRIQMVYGALSCLACNGDIDNVDAMSSDAKAKLLGRAMEIVAASLLGEAANVYANIGLVSNGQHTPGAFPADAATRIATTV